MKNCQEKGDVVSELIRYQQTGHDFTSAWAGIEPIVREFAAWQLRKMGVTACRRRRTVSGQDNRERHFAADESALGDVVHDTALVLLELGTMDAKGRFDPTKAKPGISGLRGWLWRVVESQAVDWVRANRGRSGLKVIPESSLEQRSRFHRDEPGSFFDQLAAKPVRQDVLPILEDCIARLPDTFHGQIVLRKLYDELSIRQTSQAMMVPTSRVQRQLVRALALLKPLIEGHGIDESRLEA